MTIITINQVNTPCDNLSRIILSQNVEKKRINIIIF